MPKPWERQPGEGDERWEAFTIYRDLGPDRSLAAVSSEVQKNPTLMGKWSREQGWVRRAAAWDEERDRQRREALARRAVTAAERHADILADSLWALSAPIKELVRRLQTGEFDIQNMANTELVRLSKDLAKVIPALIEKERLVLGQSTTNLGGHDGGPVKLADRHTPEELDRYLAGVVDGTAEELEDEAEETETRELEA